MQELLNNIVTPVYLIFLLYGAAFLFLGVSIVAKNMRGSDLKLAGSLWMLSAFGFLHGSHEWLELGVLIEGGNLSFSQIFAVKTVSTFLVILSFVFLLQFGISLVCAIDEKKIRWVRMIPAPLFLLWAVYVWYYGFHEEGFHIDMQSLRQANIGVRHTFGFVGGLMTAYGLMVNSREVMSLSRPMAQKLRSAAVAFCIYAVLAGILSSWYYVPFFATPVVVFRGATAFIITYLIIKALNVFDIELRIRYSHQAGAIIQSEKLTSLGRFAAGIAHEINNPLTSASLGIQTLKSRAAANGARRDIVERLGAIEEDIDRASVIAAELLQFSRQKAAEFVSLDVSDPIRGALTLLRHRLRDITVTQDLAPVPLVLGDRGKLEQVLVNVLANAVEAMPDGGEICIKTAKNNGSVLIHISDTGPGIPQENILKVFDPFFTTKDVGQGTGLGLSICYGIIQQHQGTIDIANTPGRGAVVSIKLPAAGGSE